MPLLLLELGPSSWTSVKDESCDSSFICSSFKLCAILCGAPTKITQKYVFNNTSEQMKREGQSERSFFPPPVAEKTNVLRTSSSGAH